MANKNIDFNFEEYSVNVIQHIDSLRSILTFGDENEIKEEADASVKESRINAFYRAVGLPAVIPAKKDKDDPDASIWELSNFKGGVRPDKYNNGNLHEIDFTPYEKDLDNRQTQFDKQPDEKEIIAFMQSNTYNFKSSIVKKSENDVTMRKRGVLFPMVVDGRIHIKPQSKRVAGAFMTDQERKSKIDQKTFYHQPLIETILYIRLKGENLVNSVEQDSTSAAFNTEDIKNLTRYNLSSLKSLNDNGAQRIMRTLRCVGPSLRETIRKLRKARKLTGIEVVPVAGAIAQQNPKTRLRVKKKRLLDRLAARQEDKEAIQDTILSLFEYDQIEKRNVKGGALAGALIEILTPKPRKKRVAARKEKQGATERLNKQKGVVKSSYRSMELLLGTFAGISGTDILAVTAALYLIDTKYLIALLNKESKERLKLIKGENVLSQASGISVATAIEKLETKVTNVFEVIEGSSVNKHENDPQNQPEKDEGAV